MTKIYSINALLAELDDKEAGTLRREHTKFREANPDREFTPVYHDEQIPIDTVYKVTDLKSELKQWIENGVRVSKNVPTGEPEIVRSGKIWASSTAPNLSMNVLPVPYDLSMYGKGVDEYDWMWRIFDGDHMFTKPEEMKINKSRNWKGEVVYKGRRIDMNWSNKTWNSIFGSNVINNMWKEEINNMDKKFYDKASKETKELLEGEWQEVVIAYISYFCDILYRKIMREHRDNYPLDEAVGIVMLAMCEFALRIKEEGEPLEARFFTAAYSAIRNAYRDAVDSMDIMSNKTRQKVHDMRTLNKFLHQFKEDYLRYPSPAEIKEGLKWGDKRYDSTTLIYDERIGNYRHTTDEEKLYDVMNNYMTEQQAAIIERLYGLDGHLKMSAADVAEDLGIAEITVARNKKDAINIIKEHLGKFFEKSSK